MSLLTLYLNLLLMLPPGDGLAQIPSSASAAQEDPHEVVMTVTVTTLDWHYVTGLRSEDFMIFEDRVSRQITYFEFKNVPASILVLVDVSGSIEPDRRAGSIIQRVRMKQALEQFVQSTESSNEWSLLSFAESSRILLDWTTDRAALLSAFGRLVVEKPKGKTALYEACYFALEKLRNSNNRKRVLLLISDGENNKSHLKMSRIRRLLQETGTLIYAIDVGPLIRSLSQPSAIEWVGPRNLGELALESGGFAFHPTTAEELHAIFVLLAGELRWQYLIGFLPAPTSDIEKWHPIEIKLSRRLNVAVSQKDLIVRSRSGYYPVP
jgi:Ca-activated chloride channel family protein